MQSEATKPFKDFLSTAFDKGSYATDDVIAFLLPLLREVSELHEAGLVAPFEIPRTLFVDGDSLDINEKYAHAPKLALGKLRSLFQAYGSKSFNISGHSQTITDVDSGLSEHEQVYLHLDAEKPLDKPGYLLGYRCFEHLLGHHDIVTDVFCLGLILGSISLGLDLYDEADLRTFADCRTRPVHHNPRIHPTVSALITEMTELDRNKRSRDLYDVINRLQHYRDYDPEKQTDLSQVAGWVQKEINNKQNFILNKLRNRLFDTSRRNRLLFYKGNMRFVNLTVSSVPIVLDYRSIDLAQLFIWNADISAKVKGMKEISLNKYLRFEDHAYVPGQLDRMRLEAQRDVNEYGFSQLKLVVAFLDWHNLKEDKNERIQSPLLLIPVELRKKKGLQQDHYTLQVLANEAEINPVLSNQLRELYGIRLPDYIDLDDMDLPHFHALIKGQIDQVNQGIQLAYVDKPRIKLIHAVAKLTVSTYQKKLRKTGRTNTSYRNIEYSYSPEHYQPLGLAIFRERIEPKPGYLGLLMDEDIHLAPKNMIGDDAANLKEKELFHIHGSENNPYSWDVDTCNMVLGNFNYKKMSLVRDYNYIMDEKVGHHVFDKLFSEEPKGTPAEVIGVDKPSEWFHVITADPTQAKAILQSRNKESYVIQGPPGTGKSQTITNLIADFIAQGKNILFVCEKRAALDVVFHRLKQQRLDELCCYIHDSQGDKKALIQNLKSTYEDFLNNKMDLTGITIRRNNCLQKLQEQLDLLAAYHRTNNTASTKAGLRVRELIDRLIVLKPHATTLSAQQQESMPHYSHWLAFGDTILQLSKALEESGASVAFAEHPLSQLNEELFLRDKPVTQLDQLLQTSKRILGEIAQITAQNNIPAEHVQKLSNIKNLIQDAVLLQPLAASNNLQLVKSGTKESKAFEKKIQQYQQAKKQQENAYAKNSNWVNKFSEQDVANAIPIVAKQEGSFFRFLNGTWRKLKKQLQDSYNFTNHQVKPSYVEILTQLQAEYDAEKNVAQQRQDITDNYGIDNIEITHLGIETLRNKQGDKEVDFLLAHPQGSLLVGELYKLNHTLHDLEIRLHQTLRNIEGKHLQQIHDELEGIGMNMDAVQELLPSLMAFAKLPTEVRQAISDIPLTPQQAEADMAFKTWQWILDNSQEYAMTDESAIHRSVNIIQDEYKKLLELNASFIRADIRRKFLQHIELTNLAMSQLSVEQKEIKKKYNEGRKILENEFGKSMRYKSIRELAAKESGLVLKDLKPVWLMSPLSVSDSLPVDVGYFDVVIFDEASQITLEEGIPALYRAKQTIIVGDEMQMPPTNFFTAKAGDPDDLEALEQADFDEVLSSDADSLLTQGARKMNSVMLGWHYRSRYETLISYSNHAFYNKDLLTIPDRTIHHDTKPEIVAQLPEDAVRNVTAMMARSISYHYLPNSIYEKRGNVGEAVYIAHMVRELLKNGLGQSIGVVAFSQEQQHQIEDALAALAATDKDFDQQLEAEYTRTEDDQFIGLIIKNLENIQGDERDIIIMSVCYGPDARQKMLMNFGPINRKGGEKRLNVIFSRAKKHMAIVSSIKHISITNEYNDGANYLKKFLHYAEMVSAGNMAVARIILDNLVLGKKGVEPTSAHNYMLVQIQQILAEKGYGSKLEVGQSTFKCSLAVKLHKEDEAYTLSVVLDDAQHYENPNWLEQYFQRPAILQSFGWRVIAVFAKDWLQQPGKVIHRILDRLERKIELPTEPAMQPMPLDTPSQQLAPQAGTSTAAIPQLAFTRLEYRQGDVATFWEIACSGNKLTLRTGKVGTRGQTQVKTLHDDSMAAEEMDRMIVDKQTQGYILS